MKMEQLISKVRWTNSLGRVLSKVSQQQANRIANIGLAAAVILLLGAEEHARRTWRDRAVESQENLTQVRHFLALEREHVKKLCDAEEMEVK